MNNNMAKKITLGKKELSSADEFLFELREGKDAVFFYKNDDQYYQCNYNDNMPKAQALTFKQIQDTVNSWLKIKVTNKAYFEETKARIIAKGFKA